MQIVFALTTILTLFSKSQCSPENIFLRPLAAVVNPHLRITPTVSLRTNAGEVKRQVDFNKQKVENFLHCSRVVTRHECEGAYVQDRLGVILTCGNESLARLGAQGCATNENGEYCTIASLSLSLQAAELTSGAAACLSGGGLSCSSACRNFLLSLKSSLGCCINSVLNTTDNPASASLAPIFSSLLWRRCNVAAPTRCTNGLTLSQMPADAQTGTCTTKQLAKRLAEYDCTGYNMQPVVETLLSEGRCSDLVKTTVDGCGINSNGQYCSEVVNNDALSLAIDTSSIANNVLVALGTNCNSVGTTTCSPSCQQTIQTANLEYGCCLNIYNQSVRALGTNYPSLSYETWTSCGVDPQGACKSTLSDARREDEFAWLISLLPNSS